MSVTLWQISEINHQSTSQKTNKILKHSHCLNLLQFYMRARSCDQKGIGRIKCASDK